MKLPKFIEEAIKNNNTSLGEHPAFPPEEEQTFVEWLLTKQYEKVMDELGTLDNKETSLSNQLDTLVAECQKIEEPHKQALEELCSKICSEIFDIPEDTIQINGNIVNECDMSKYRMVPEETIDFQFDDIEDMTRLTDEIYKRRMINSLIAGASMYYANRMDLYIKELYSINPRLSQIYNDINLLNMAVLYNQKDSIKNMEKTNTGKVDVNIGDENEKIVIEAEGIIFPILLEYTMKGILEVAALHGLPETIEKAEYVMSKADFRLAENWDMRLGLPLWNIIVSILGEHNIDITDIGANFLIMEISCLENDSFNHYLQNTFKKTKAGIGLTLQMVKEINYNKEKDDFDNFIQQQNQKFSINDNNEYTAEELLAEIEL